MKTNSLAHQVKQKPFYSLRETADICGVNPRTIRRWIHSGKLPAFKLSGLRSSPYKIAYEDIPSFYRKLVIQTHETA